MGVIVTRMDVRYPPQAEQFRQKVRAFLAEHLPSDWAGIGTLAPDEVQQFTDEWRALLYEHGFLGLAWPVEYGGGGLTKVEQLVLAEEMASAGVPAGSANDLFSLKMVGNLLLKWGTEEQKRYFLPRILSGELQWCQGFSEPDAGSDLAGLKTRARLDGGQWRIDGQKMWTSEAATANWIFLLVRTRPTAPKHQGLSFLLCPLDQPGIEVRPIKMLSGQSMFNEVFFTDARTDAANIVGGDGDGWAVAGTLLSHERGEDAAIHPILFRIETRPAPSPGPRAGPGRRPADPRPLGPVLSPGGDHAVPRLPDPDHRPAERRPPRTRGVDRQALLERVPPGGHGARSRHPRCRRHGPHRPLAFPGRASR